MTTIFLVCAVIGGTILAFQFVMTFVGLSDSDLSVADHHPDSLHTALGSDLGVSDGHGSSTMFQVLSFKTVVAAFTFFGIAGMAAASGGHSRPVQLTIAVIAGLGALYGVYYLLLSVARLAQSGNLRISNTVGRTGTVIVAIPADNIGQGKVQVKIQNRLEVFTAITAAGRKLNSGAKVVVVGVVNENTIEVEPLVESA